MALPVLSAVVTRMQDFTDAGQSVAAPVVHVLTAKATADGLAAEAAGSDSVLREYPVPVISPTPPASVSVTRSVTQSLVESKNWQVAGSPLLASSLRPSLNERKSAI